MSNIFFLSGRIVRPKVKMSWAFLIKIVNEINVQFFWFSFHFPISSIKVLYQERCDPQTTIPRSNLYIWTPILLYLYKRNRFIRMFLLELAKIKFFLSWKICHFFPLSTQKDSSKYLLIMLRSCYV